MQCIGAACGGKRQFLCVCFFVKATLLLLRVDDAMVTVSRPRAVLVTISNLLLVHIWCMVLVDGHPGTAKR